MPTSIAPFLKRQVSMFLLALGLFLAQQALDWLLVMHHTSLGPADLCQLDCHWYTGIATQGYEAIRLENFDFSRKANLAFFPLFPITAGLLIKFTGLWSVFAVLLSSKFFFLLAIYAFMIMGKMAIHSVPVFSLGAVAAFNPYAIYGNSGYTESLFLVLTCIFFILLMRRAYLAASLAGGLLSATRLVGVVALIPYLLHGIRGWSRQSVRSRRKMVAGLFLIPSGLALFMLHLSQKTGDPLAFITIQKSWGRTTPTVLLSPLASLYRALSTNWWMYRYWALTALVVLIVCVILLFRRIHPELASFSLLATLLPLSSDCWGMSRYVWWQAPVLLFVAWLFGRRPVLLLFWLVVSILTNIWCYRLWFSETNWFIS